VEVVLLLARAREDRDLEDLRKRNSELRSILAKFPGSYKREEEVGS